MKRLFCMMLVFLSISAFSQKEIKVVSFKQSTSDISARTKQREDPKGEVCALVKVQLPIRNALFEGDIIGEIDHKTNEYWVYMPPKSMQLVVKIQDFKPLKVDFNEHGISSLDTKGTYELCVIEDEISSPQLYTEGMKALAENNMAMAFEKLEKASEAGYAPAAFALGEASIIPYDKYYDEDPNTIDAYQDAYNYYKKAAEGKNPEAQYALGELLEEYQSPYPPESLSHITIDSQLKGKAMIWDLFRKAADKGNINAQYRMISDDNWCKENAEKGVAVAEFGMGLRFDEELSTDEYPMLDCFEVNRAGDYDVAFDWYQKAANHGLDVAQWRLGELYARGLGVEKNIDKALYWRKKAAEQGSVIFQLVMAMSYNYGEISNLETFQSYGTSENALDSWGIEISENSDEADYWLRKLNNHCFTYKEKYTINSNSMYSDAMYILAKDLEKKGEYGKAIYWYQRTGEKEGDEFYRKYAFANLGRIFLEGLAGEKDYSIAKRYLEQGMEVESCEAACFLGILYRDGLGVEKDFDKAIGCFMKSIEFDDTENRAYFEMGILYYQQEQYDKAFEYFKKTRSNGYDSVTRIDGVEKYTSLNKYRTMALYNLGRMLYNGVGCEEDVSEAIECLTESARRGCEEAKNVLVELGLPIPKHYEIYEQ